MDAGARLEIGWKADGRFPREDAQRKDRGKQRTSGDGLISPRTEAIRNKPHASNSEQGMSRV